MAFVGLFSSIVNIIGTLLIAPLIKQTNYLRSSSDNIGDLQIVVQNLKARRNDEQSTSTAEENAGKVKTDAARNWFKAIHEIEMEAATIENGRSVKLKLKADLRLKEQVVLTKSPSPKCVLEMESEPIENQPSAQRMLQQMLDCIGDPGFGIIGVYVSAAPNIRSIQISIGKRLGLDLTDNREVDAKEKLFDALRKKKFFLILDNLWYKLELDYVGIPHPRNQRGSKILVTSRNQDVCTDMDARITIEVQPLSEDESWNLFVVKAGQHVIANHIKCYAEKIVR
ncbi:probable disease resistance protein At1g62630 [Macadamia integrifolia]|uniref:probable disease resistance protein At1g62630 n=1 Tax=Macadamia integrifolia TaxID=60698 RepID=UPI001C4F9080|nr:probable disease resistance protein At1g62630 [Macadamia integrifolia]